MTNFTLGCDPEVFIYSGNNLVSADGIIPGTKHKPFEVKGYGISLQVDGLAAEFNTPPVASGDITSFVHHVANGLVCIRDFAQKADQNYTVKCKSVAKFTDVFAKAQPFHSMELGCDPDFNAYTMNVTPPPNVKENFRTGAGHLHIGWGYDIPLTEEHFEICADFIRTMDACVGLPLILMEDKDASIRRSLYGKAGAFRPKTYGVEYRTPSNCWLAKEENMFIPPLLTNMAIKYQQRCSEEGRTVSQSLFGMSEEAVRKALDDGDKEAALYCLNTLTRKSESRRLHAFAKKFANKEF